jgi:hypothetical protein
VAADQYPRNGLGLLLLAVCTGSLMLLPACGKGGVAAGAERHHHASSEDSLVNVPISCWPGCHGPVMTSVIAGVLAGSPKVEGGCLWLEPIHGPARRMPVLWPEGYHARLNPVELVNSEGSVVARSGDRVVFGGGASGVPASGRCMFGQGTAAIVQSSIAIKGRG